MKRRTGYVRSFTSQETEGALKYTEYGFLSSKRAYIASSSQEKQPEKLRPLYIGYDVSEIHLKCRIVIFQQHKFSVMYFDDN